MDSVAQMDVFSYGIFLWEVVTKEIPMRGRLRAPRVPEECAPFKASCAYGTGRHLDLISSAPGPQGHGCGCSC